MAFLARERECLDRVLPGLRSRLCERSLEELESPGSPAISIARDLNAPALLVPGELGGLGASARDAARVHRAMASAAPSLGVALTMHNFSVATLVAYHMYGGEGKQLLAAVADRNLLLASGFAEGRSDSSILDSQMAAVADGDGYRISGSKKPCSLSGSMDILTAGVSVEGDAEGRRRAIAIIPAESPGIERRSFWANRVLAGAESDEVLLRDVRIPKQLLFFPEGEELDAAEIGGFCWFELLMSATYLGIASALVERALASSKGGSVERALLGIEIESSMSALEGLASALDGADLDDALLPGALFARFAAQNAIQRAVSLAAELLGGMNFIASSDISYLLAASRALAFHPPSRTSISPSLDHYLTTGEFGMGAHSSGGESRPASAGE